jgi:hypothetical protein
VHLSILQSLSITYQAYFPKLSPPFTGGVFNLYSTSLAYYPLFSYFYEKNYLAAPILEEVLGMNFFGKEIKIPVDMQPTTSIESPK